MSRLSRALVVLVLVAAGCGDDGAGGDEAPVDDTSTSVADATDTTTTTLGVSPPTSRGVPAAVAVDPLPADPGSRAVLAGEPAYRGVLGQVAPERIVVAPLALPPEPASRGTSPLTGLALADESAANRPAIVAKIDNSDRGRPQESLSQADLVFEEVIEGGFTRLAAVFHSRAPLLGPVRSGRTTDIALLGSLGRPIFAWSGANLVHAALLREQDMIDLGAQSRAEYFRDRERPGTYNLMVEAATLFDIAAGRGELGPPPTQFEYRDDTISLPSVAVPATAAVIAFPSVTAEWSWIDDGWARTQDDEEHIDAAEERVVAANVVVAEVGRVPTGSVDTSGSTVFEQVFLGSGRAWVFTDGHVVEATWTKPSIDSVPTWTTADDIPVPLVPGTTWVELAPPGALSWS